MSSTIGANIKLTVFGQSHSPAVGVTIDSFPAGLEVDMAALERFMQRRAPGGRLSSERSEADKPEFICGITDGKTNGTPITAIIRNTDIKPQDYASLADTPRPGHADFTARMKYGSACDLSGGGHFSGRLTAPLCVAGGLCIQWLEKHGVAVGAHIASIHGIKDEAFNPVEVSVKQLEKIKERRIAVISESAGEKMKAEIAEARQNGNSVGGVIECAVLGLPVGVGEPIFGGIENQISVTVFGIPAVKGIEFGAGFALAEMTGLESNDSFYYNDSHEILTRTNNCGGILGGISNGMPLIFRAVFKPTPSIAAEQDTVSYSSGESTRISVVGRHDPCIALRAVPCIEAAAAFAVTDLMAGGDLS